MENEDFDVDALIGDLIEREGGYGNHPADKAGRPASALPRRSHGTALPVQ
ncbi:MAG: hypothetical protein ACM3X2_02985 [Pseudomonadota bacterium]